MASARGRGRDPVEFIETFAALWKCLMAVSDDAYAADRLWSAQARFVRYIGQHRGISQAELARETDMAPTLTGRLLQTLIRRGHVRRTRSKADRREYVLALSASGQHTRRRVEAARARFAARVVDVLDDRDLRDFARIAGKLFDAFGRPGAGCAAETEPDRPRATTRRRSPDHG